MTTEDLYFWVFVLICIIAFAMVFNMYGSQLGLFKEGFDGINHLDPTDLANPDPKNVYVTLNALTAAEKNFQPDVGPYQM